MFLGIKLFLLDQLVNRKEKRKILKYNSILLCKEDSLLNDANNQIFEYSNLFNILILRYFSILYKEVKVMNV